jgi:hypothetical protein
MKVNKKEKRELALVSLVNAAIVGYASVISSVAKTQARLM